MTEVIDKREAMANQLLMRGHATMLELLTASFGEWPPKGLDINPAVSHDQKVELKAFFERGVRGNATMLGQNRVIQVRKNLFGTVGLNATLAHEATHILQGDHADRMESPLVSAPLPLAAEVEMMAQMREREKSLIGKIVEGIFGGKKKPLPKEEPQEEAKPKQGKAIIASNLIMKELTDQQGTALRTKYNTDKKEFSYLTYLKQGFETQARIHEIIIAGYPRWGKVPANGDEFLAAMKNAGLKLPPAIEKHLESLPANSSAHHFLSCAMGQKTETTNDIQTLNNSFLPDSRIVLWNKTMPALYADLVEMYGDGPGRERFGLGVNPKAAAPVKISQNAKPAETAGVTERKPTIPSPG